MINFSTPSDVMLREIMADKKKSFYWLTKKMGSEKKYEAMRDGLLIKARKEKRNKISEVFEYRSANGNRWMTYECARYFPQSDSSYTEPYAFCFYETLGSVGAFVPVKVGLTQESGTDAVVIFTSHFFYQMCERLKITYRSLDMVRAFHEFIPSMLLKVYKEEDRVKLIARLPGSTGWGFKRDGDADVFEVRTFLSDIQLNGRQRKLSSDIRTHADKFAYEPTEVMMTRLQQKVDKGESLQSDIDAMKAKMMLMGVPEEKVDVAYAVNMAVVSAYAHLGLADAEDQAFWRRHAEVNGSIIADYVMTIDGDNERFLDLLDACAKNLNLKKYSRDDAIRAFENLNDK